MVEIVRAAIPTQFARQVTQLALALSLALVVARSDPVLAEPAPAKVVLVRHAEYGPDPGDDLGPPLNDAGRKRAAELANLLKGDGVTVILTSRYRRTRETASRAGEALGVMPTVVPDDNIETHINTQVAAIRSARGTVLVVGHGDTIPEIIVRLGGPRIATLCGTSFDRMFTLAPAGGRMELTRRLYGDPSPGVAPNCP